jgi:hypothetical protein
MPITYTHKILGLTGFRFYHSGVIDTAVTIIGDFLGDFLRKSEALFKKSSTRVSGAQLMYEKNQRS